MRRSLRLAATALLAACSSAEPFTPEPIDASHPPPPPPPEDAGVDAGPEPLDVPASLVAALGGKTYVEGTCAATTYAGWPFEAQRCTYRNGLVVTIANPPPERVARWIVDASRVITALDALRMRDRASWETGLRAIAAHTIGQSSRIFPLDGQVWENGTAYRFERGVTRTCSSGCYCRINSTSRPQWCAYAVDVLGVEPTVDGCLAKYGQSTNTLAEPWLAHCLANHIEAWNQDRNDHYRAQAFAANKLLVQKGLDPMTAAPTAVLAALDEAYPR